MSLHYYKIYKPYGYLSQFISNQRGNHKKKYLGELHQFPDNIMAVGRLDETSEGLLFLTTDGKFSNRTNSRGVEKEYYAQVDGMITPSAVKLLETGIDISIHGKNYRTLPCKAKIIPIPLLPPTPQHIRDDRHGPTSWVSIVLTEGKFRQVRKMTAAVGFPTLRLARVRIGNEILGDMQPGDCLPINPD